MVLVMLRLTAGLESGGQRDSEQNVYFQPLSFRCQSDEPGRLSLTTPDIVEAAPNGPQVGGIGVTRYWLAPFYAAYRL